MDTTHLEILKQLPVYSRVTVIHSDGSKVDAIKIKDGVKKMVISIISNDNKKFGSVWRYPYSCIMCKEIELLKKMRNE